MMTEVEVMKIRYLYFEYFCQLLKEFPAGLSKSAKMTKPQKKDIVAEQPGSQQLRCASGFTSSSVSMNDVDEVFNKSSFLLACEVTN